MEGYYQEIAHKLFSSFNKMQKGEIPTGWH